MRSACRHVRLAAAGGLALLAGAASARPAGAQVVPGVAAENGFDVVSRYRAQVRAEVDALLERYRAAWRRDALDSLAALYASDAGLVAAAAPPATGRRRVIDALRPLLKSARGITFAVARAEPAEDQVFVSGTSEVDIDIGPGERIRVRAPFSMIGRRAFPGPWEITWHRFDAPVLEPARVLAGSRFATRLVRREGELLPGDTLPAFGRLPLGAAEFLAYVMRGGTRRVEGIERRVVDTVVADGAALLRVVRVLERADGFTADTSLLRRHTLQPVRAAARRGDGRRVTLDFSLEAVAELDGRGRPVTRTEIADPVFDAAALTELALALPIESVTRVILRAYDAERGLVELSVANVGTEDLSLPDGRTTPTWVIATDGAGRGTLWVARDTRRVLRAVTELPDGGERWLVRIDAPREH
jgi:ketosteroid isomerase-like protein